MRLLSVWNSWVFDLRAPSTSATASNACSSIIKRIKALLGFQSMNSRARTLSPMSNSQSNNSFNADFVDIESGFSILPAKQNTASAILGHEQYTH